MKVKYVNGDELAKLLKRQGKISPERTYMHPRAMTQYGVITIGDTKYHYPIYSAQEHFCLDETQKLSDKLDKLFADMKEKKDPDDSR